MKAGVGSRSLLDLLLDLEGLTDWLVDSQSLDPKQRQLKRREGGKGG